MQVYVSVKPGDLKGDGTLISGNQVDLKLSGNVNNSGTIAGRELLSLNAQTIANLGGRMQCSVHMSES